MRLRPRTRRNPDIPEPEPDLYEAELCRLEALDSTRPFGTRLKRCGRDNSEHTDRTIVPLHRPLGRSLLLTLRDETDAWSTDVNATQRGVDWQMRIDDARAKLKSVYPTIKL